MAKKSVKKVVTETTKKVEEAAKETLAEDDASVSKEGKEAAVATKSFFKEVGEFFAAVGKAIAKFFRKLFKKA